MGTAKKYLDLTGLQQLKSKRAIVVHPTITPVANQSALKFSVDAYGHITGTSTLTAADLGVGNAMHFVGISTTDPQGSTGPTISGHTTWTDGEVVLYKRDGESGYEEYIRVTPSGGTAKWELLGDADSYSLKGHTHSVTVSLPANTAIATVTPTNGTVGVSSTSATFVKSYPGVTSSLVTTSISGVSGSTVASKATAGTAVTYGNANVGTEVTGIAKRGSLFTYGNANVAATATSVVNDVTKTSASFVNATYNETATSSIPAETLVLTTASAVTAVTASKASIYEAVTSSTSAYACGETVSIKPAVASTSTITPYTFADVTVPKAATAVTVATGALSTTGTGDTVMTGLGTATTDKALTGTSLTGTTTFVAGVTTTKNAATTLNGGAAASNS